jgi:hypothetical protein
LNKKRAGEARFLFNVLGPGGNPSLFNVIMEYELPGAGPAAVLDGARRWHALGGLAQPGEAYNQALQELTDRVVARGARPRAPSGSALVSMRTNDFSLATVWELRQFGLGADGALHEQPVDLTPDTATIDGTQALADLVNQRAAAILRGTFQVPLRFEGAPFRGSSSINLLESWSSPGIRDPEARHAFAIATCNGCHSTPETGTNFLQVEPRAAGTASVISGFLQGMAVIDPFSGEARTFNDLGRRKTDLEHLVCGPCDSATLAEGIYRTH